ncbi:uncharacterized protein Tco025E_07692 [Trypanosoma conorhini]|uniref:Uncharacterized protein n=1 Tax=Trypanosoma conorhini TaxID=83891 RepID=A0A422NKI0_9TRYP|nr:uncharacterized protein Tco025E_07692 [Trypanosoma conorhini]RNF05966.1 hypothetical protein Tco025E_07692 [Trypanosoma conorhini]
MWRRGRFRHVSHSLQSCPLGLRAAIPPTRRPQRWWSPAHCRLLRRRGAQRSLTVAFTPLLPRRPPLPQPAHRTRPLPQKKVTRRRRRRRRREQLLRPPMCLRRPP